MTINDMHNLFRVLGQQMGMQNVRAILPESIDLYLNNAIIKKVRTLLLENLKIDGESRIITRRDTIVPINALRTLYSEYDDYLEEVESSIEVTPTLSKLMVILGVSIMYADNGKIYECRLIDSIELANTLNDYCNRPDKENPIAVYIDGHLRLYFGENSVTGEDRYFVKYVKLPATVSLSGNTDCDLPEYLHNEIVENAVKMYFTSINNGLNKQ